MIIFLVAGNPLRASPHASSTNRDWRFRGSRFILNMRAKDRLGAHATASADIHPSTLERRQQASRLMDKLIIVIDDPGQNGFALQQWLAASGQRSERLASYAEMSATIAYQQVAGFLPGLIIGPMTADGALFAQALRAQSPTVAFAFYTESPARWQDDQIRRQFGCVAILHKPFSADRVEILGLTTGPALERAFAQSVGLPGFCASP